MVVIKMEKLKALRGLKQLMVCRVRCWVLGGLVNMMGWDWGVRRVLGSWRADGGKGGVKRTLGC